MKNKKGSFMLDNLGWWVLGFIFLVVVVILYFILSGKSDSLIAFFSDLSRSRRV